MVIRWKWRMGMASRAQGTAGEKSGGCDSAPPTWCTPYGTIESTQEASGDLPSLLCHMAWLQGLRPPSHTPAPGRGVWLVMG